MCGICGAIDYNRNSAVNEELLNAMCAELRHRGPDGQGVFVDRGTPLAGLGHRRLSIIDLSASGHQPMPNEDKTVWVVLNGEIYNYRELRPLLEEKGHRFRSNTDTEVLIHLYEEHGEKCLDFLRGMFAFAIWDARQRALFLARDRAGKKPLLYSHSGGVFCFASEFCAFLRSGLIKKEINYEAIHYYLTYGYIPAPLTIYKGVSKLPPAHKIILKENKLTLSRYWQLDYSRKSSINEGDAAGEILRLLKEATRIRLHSDVPLGAFLSGGIDSSTIVALMSECSGRKVKTFSIGFEEGGFSELKYANNIAERYGTEHREFIVKPVALEVLPLLVERYGEPYADSSCIPTYYVSRQTKEYVTVALNGDGGDESFAGYERYQGMVAAEAYKRLPRFFRTGLSRVLCRLPDSINPKNRLRNIRRFFEAANLPAQFRYLQWVGIFNNSARDSLYSENFKSKIAKNDPIDWLAPYLNNPKDLCLLDRLLMADVHTYLPNDLLVKVDIASMCNSLEARSPFLDHKIMEFAAGLPAGYKMRHLVKKYILKKSIKDLVPKENVYRRKMGFGVPVGEWLRGELKDFLNETLLSSASLNRGYFRPEAIKEMVREHAQARVDYTMQLWALLMLELWHIRFVDR